MSRRAWRPTLATIALMVYATFVFYFLVTVVLPWATQGLGEPWDFTPGSVQVEYALYRGYWLRFTPKGIDVLGPSRRRVLGSFLSASSARLYVRALART